MKLTAITYEEMETKGKELVEKHETFEVRGLSGRMGSAISAMERIIEENGMKCRVYTYGRIAAAVGSVFGGVTGVAGVASAIGIAAHNVATFDPDYEIAKHLVDHKLSVNYKK